MNLEMIYQFGIIFGIIILYVIVTFGIGLVLSMIRGDDLDILPFIAYIIGAFAFMFLAIYTLKETGKWDIISDNDIVVEAEIDSEIDTDEVHN